MSFVNLLDVIYPVGSLYLSAQNTSPAKSIGGSWIQITDKFLRAGNDFNVGGVATHVHSLTSGIAALNIQGEGLFFKNVRAGFTANKYLTPTGSQNTNAINNGHGDAVALLGNSGSTSSLPPYQNIYVWYRVS